MSCLERAVTMIRRVFGTIFRGVTLVAGYQKVAYGRRHDTIYFYTKSTDWTYNYQGNHETPE